MSESSRRLAVIMFTDIVGYTAIMAKDESRALAILEKNRAIHKPIISEHQGEWLKEMGDGVLAAFNSTTDALRAAESIVIASKQQGIDLRVGIHLGEVLFQDGDVFGDGVNVASRVESMAGPGSVIFTERVHDDIVNKPEFQAVELGERSFKNVPKPMTVYALQSPGLSVPEKFDRDASVDLSSSKNLRIGVLSAAVVLVVALIAWQVLKSSSTVPVIDKVDNEFITLAALPFSNISQEKDIDFLGFALVDEVISSLSYLQRVNVRPSSSIRKYAGQVIDPAEVGEVLAVQYVLMGHYVKSGQSVRLNLELIDIEANNVLWRGSVQEQMDDVFKLQDIVANHVIKGLEIQFSDEERQRMIEDIPANPEAYEFYLRAIDLPTSVEGNDLAIEMLEQSILMDSLFAPAYARLGSRYQMKANYSLMVSRPEFMQKGREALWRAIEINPTQLTALGNLAVIETEDHKLEEVLELADRMNQINPNDAMMHFVRGYAYRYVGMLDMAVDDMALAVSIDPNNQTFRSIIVTYSMAGRYEDALLSVNHNDGSGFVESWQGITYLKMGDVYNAERMFREAYAIDSLGTLGAWVSGFLSEMDGDGDEWVDKVREIRETVLDPESLYFWTLAGIACGDIEPSMVSLRAAIENGYYPYEAFAVDPLLDPVRDHPDFEEIMALAKKKQDDFAAWHRTRNQ